MAEELKFNDPMKVLKDDEEAQQKIAKILPQIGKRFIADGGQQPNFLFVTTGTHHHDPQEHSHEVHLVGEACAISRSLAILMLENPEIAEIVMDAGTQYIEAQMTGATMVRDIFGKHSGGGNVH